MRACIGVAILLAGCAAPVGETPAVSDPIPYALDQQGISVVGASGRIDFGRTDHSTIPAMTKLVGRRSVDQVLCATGIERMTWPDGVTLYFAGGNFVGWSREETSGTIQQAGRTCTSA